MTPDNLHDDSLDPAIRDRLYTGRPAVDALNSTVPQADADRRDALEQRLMARVLEGKAPGKNRPMIHNAALYGAYETPRRFQISTSLLLTGAVGVLCAAVLVFASFNRPPQESDLPAVAPINRDQDATAVPMETATPAAFEATATPIPFEGRVTMPPTIPATGVPGSVTDVPDSGFTATPIPFAGGIEGVMATATPVPFPDAMQLVPTFPPFVGSEMEPPMIWVPGNGNISAPNSSGLVVAIPSARLRPMELAAEITEGQIVNLYTTLSLSTDGSDDAAGGFNTAMVSVAASTQVISVNDAGTIAVWVPLEQGIVLTWLLNDTPAAITYEQAEQ
jgi:hypothetical protein